MADEVLSQAEVESLLSAMESHTARAAAAAPAGAAPSLAGTARPPLRPRDKVTPYDFKRPERVGKEQMRALQSLHEGFGRNFGASLSALRLAIALERAVSLKDLNDHPILAELATLVDDRSAQRRQAAAERLPHLEQKP